MRPLGSTETAVWFVDQTCSLNFCMVAHLSARADSERLRQAIAAAGLRHPLLGATITATTELRFETAAAPPAMTESSGDWQARAQHHITTRFESGAALARFELVHGEAEDVLLACFHHCIGDGISGANLLRDVLAAYNGHPPAPDSHVPAALEAILPPEARGLRRVWRLLRFALWNGWQLLRFRGTPMLPRLDADARAPRTAHFVHLAFNAPQTAAIQRCAQALGCTVHGVIGAALSRAMIPETHPLVGAPVLSFGSVVNLRQRLISQPAEDVGLYVSIASALTANPARREFGETARAITAQVKTQMGDGTSLVLIPTISLLFMRRRFFRFSAAGVERARRVTLAVFGSVTTGLTNLGILTFGKPDDRLQVRRVHFVASPSSMGLVVATAATTQGLLSINLCAVAPQISRERAQRIAARLRKELVQQSR